MDVRAAPTRAVDPATLYAILKLRVDVFVVEQDCAYPELDGRDLEPSALMIWVQDGDAVAGTLRVLDEPDGSARIGRVVTAPAHRGSGVAAAMMTAALEQTGDRDVELHAQAHLEKWYERFGFRRSGDPYVEDGIPHVPMRRHV